MSPELRRTAVGTDVRRSRGTLAKQQRGYSCTTLLHRIIQRLADVDIGPFVNQ